MRFIRIETKTLQILILKRLNYINFKGEIRSFNNSTLGVLSMHVWFLITLKMYDKYLELTY